MSYKFIKTMESDNPHDLTSVTIELHSGASLDTMLETFEEFLKACGFCFEGIVDITHPEVIEYVPEEKKKEN